MKPLAERIDSFPPRRIVIYRCFKCDASFALLGDKIKFCYNCGEKVDWNGIITRLDKNLLDYYHQSNSSDELEEFEKQLIDEINIQQLGNTFTDLYNDDKSPKNCSQCIHVIDNEFCEIDSSERENIIIPRRLNYCGNAICNKFKERT